MSDERRDKLKRLMDVRAKQLESRVSALSSARTRQTELERRLEDARNKRSAALSDRQARLRAGLSAADWGQAENWLVGLTEQENKVRAQNDMASRAVLQARAEVAQAKREQDKIQLLLDRLRAEAQVAEARALRKMEDDLLNSNLAAKGKSGSGRAGQ
jgi:flagellar export protein FliJ